MYADIIIDITHEKLDKVFQYRIPSHLEGMLKVGTEVVVPFGKGNKEINGYVTGFSERAEYAPEKIKEILRIAEESVAIESRLVALAAWMKESYGGTMIQALKTVLPIKKKERAKEKQKVRLLLTEAEGKEKLELYLHKNQRARARLLAADPRNWELSAQVISTQCFFGLACAQKNLKFFEKRIYGHKLFFSIHG